jgi:hypothetical protein
MLYCIKNFSNIYIFPYKLILITHFLAVLFTLVDINSLFFYSFVKFRTISSI